VRDGVRAELRGLPADAPTLVTSLEGGRADLPPLPLGEIAAVVVVVGLGALDRSELTSAFRGFLQRGAVMMAVAGPQDDVEAVRGALGDVGKRALDGSLVRALVVGGVEVVALPGSDDASSLADHGRGCVLRAGDARALSARLGGARVGRPRVVASWSAPGRDPSAPVAADFVGEASAWLIGGPLDHDAPAETIIVLPTADAVSSAAGASSTTADVGGVNGNGTRGTPPPLLPIPRANVARTTTTPGVIPRGAVVIRTRDGALQFALVP
jgi:hypothetical protein